MTGPYGYPAQQPGPPGFGYPAPQAKPSGATAIIAAVLGLVGALASGFIPIRYFIELPSGFSLSNLPGFALVELVLYLVAALFLLMGALTTFFRSLIGAILLILGSLLAILAVVLEPIAFRVPYRIHLDILLRFATFDGVLRLAMVVFGLVALLLAVLPPTFRYLRWRPAPVQPYRPQNQVPRQGGW
ncbi:hypothetical protein [Amycolatopsis sp. EV170708-02-1]|uniref:hypothetical protein n=1 Tax=Amycolatopsis sp. EV170708-02-1 TaxID=2919322 RepID=UPI001F0CDD26|nr:hypothetical protein [Amycolatopsis sp. EV170708-02-1]UMP06033.1 hypothetical protein MJQ72_14985 [Amycolatopsis sp. EV170708-02-1]